MPVLDSDQVVNARILLVAQHEIREDQDAAVQFDQSRACGLGLWRPGGRLGGGVRIDSDLEPKSASQLHGRKGMWT